MRLQGLPFMRGLVELSVEMSLVPDELLKLHLVRQQALPVRAVQIPSYPISPILFAACVHPPLRNGACQKVLWIPAFVGGCKDGQGVGRGARTGGWRGPAERLLNSTASGAELSGLALPRCTLWDRSEPADFAEVAVVDNAVGANGYV